MDSYNLTRNITAYQAMQRMGMCIGSGIMWVIMWILENILQSLFVKLFHFSIFYNINSYAQLIFVFYLQRDFYIFHAHMVAFFLFLLRKGFNIFWETSFVVFPCYFGNIYTFLHMWKTIYKKINNKNIKI